MTDCCPRYDKVGFIGAGKMAEAMIRSLLSTGNVRATEVIASDITEERRRLLEKSLGIKATHSNSEVVVRSDVVFLALKPQQLEEVLAEIGPVVDENKLVISIAAGKPLAMLESRLPHARVVRVMPNLACLVGEGMNVFCAGKRVTPEHRATVSRLLSAFGKVVELPESYFDVVTAVSGSGPAFFAYFVECVARAGTEAGLAAEIARLLAIQTMLGTALLLSKKGMSPEEIIASVSSARGTTVAGMSVLGASDVAEVIARTVRAAAQRSRELSSSA